MIVFDRSRLRYPVENAFVDVLHRYVAEELAERLSFVQRRFDIGLVCGPPSPGQKRILQRMPTQWIYASPTPYGCEDVVCDLALPFCRTLPLVVSLNALHLANDPVAALGELRGALKPDGLFLGAAAARGTLAELGECLIAAESALTGGAAMRVAPFADVRQWGDALARAGFALPVADEIRVTVRFPSLAALFDDLRGMGARGVLARTTPAPRRLFERTEALYRARHADPDGKLRATFVFACLSGWAPDPSQQKPARRGSAQVPLAEALRQFEPKR